MLDGRIPFKGLLPALVGSGLWGLGRGCLRGSPWSVFVCWVHLLALSLLELGMRRRKEIHNGVRWGLEPSIEAIGTS